MRVEITRTYEEDLLRYRRSIENVARVRLTFSVLIASVGFFALGWLCGGAR